MAAWTTSDDVIESWIGDGAPTDADLVDVWVARAERLVRARVPDVQDRIDAGETDLLGTVVDVVVAAVSRVFRNPAGVRQWQETTGPFSTGGTYAGGGAKGLELTPDEVSRLRGTGRRPTAYMVDLLPDDAGESYPADQESWA
jgi:hypothetical protein